MSGSESLVSQFFNPYESPPTYIPVPGDSALAERINMLVKYALQNGPSFLTLMREKQAGDPKFAFLFGGEGSAYFRYALWASAAQPGSGGAPADALGTGQAEPLTAPPANPWSQQQQQPGAPGAPPSAAATPAAALYQDLTPEVEASFGQVLDMLSGSKVRACCCCCYYCCCCCLTDWLATAAAA